MSSEYQAKSLSKVGQSPDLTSPTDPAASETKNSDFRALPETASQTDQHSQPINQPSPAHESNQMETDSEAPQEQLRLSDMPLNIQEAWRDIQNWRRIEDIKTLT